MRFDRLCQDAFAAYTAVRVAEATLSAARGVRKKNARRALIRRRRPKPRDYAATVTEELGSSEASPRNLWVFDAILLSYEVDWFDQGPAPRSPRVRNTAPMAASRDGVR